MDVSLRTVVRSFGIEPDRVRLLKRGGNTHSASTGKDDLRWTLEQLVKTRPYRD